MTNVHMIVGSLVVLAYIIVLVLNVRAAMGRPMLAFQRPLSMAAAGLFLVQIVLGMSLLGEGEDVPASHYLIALLAIFSVGAEHMLTGREVDSQRAGRVAAITNVVTLALVLTAYMIGEMNG
jgi:heme A synthase